MPRAPSRSQSASLFTSSAAGAMTPTWSGSANRPATVLATLAASGTDGYVDPPPSTAPSCVSTFGGGASASEAASASAAASSTFSSVSAAPPASLASALAARAKSSGENLPLTPSAARSSECAASSVGTPWRYGRRSPGQSTATSTDATKPAPVQSQRASPRIVPAASRSAPPFATVSASLAYAQGSSSPMTRARSASGSTLGLDLPSSSSCAATTVVLSRFQPSLSISNGSRTMGLRDSCSRRIVSVARSADSLSSSRTASSVVA